MQIHGLAAALLSIAATAATCATEDLGQAPSVVHPQDVDVVLAAERLDEGEVDLQGHVFDVLVVGGQDAHHHVIRVPVEAKRLLLLRMHVSGPNELALTR